MTLLEWSRIKRTSALPANVRRELDAMPRPTRLKWLARFRRIMREGGEVATMLAEQMGLEAQK